MDKKDKKTKGKKTKETGIEKAIEKASEKAIEKAKEGLVEATEYLLPQNIQLVGKPPEDKQIYISQPAYKAVHKFTKGKTENESGGFLIGRVIEEFGKINIIINGFVEAKHCEATPTTLKFTHETWETANAEIAKKYADQKIVGWIHTHPDFGIFLSEYDTFIQENFFSEAYEIAYVVDPVRDLEGFFNWHREEIVKSKGFYLFDENGTEITLFREEESASEQEKAEDRVLSFDFISLLHLIITGVLVAAVIVLAINNFSLNSKIANLEENLPTLATSTSNALIQIYNDSVEIGKKNSALELRVDALEKSVNGQANQTAEPENSEDSEETAGADADGNQ